jgi:hypothetical protein
MLEPPETAEKADVESVIPGIIFLLFSRHVDRLTSASTAASR